jgi:hypothetical protein
MQDQHDVETTSTRMADNAVLQSKSAGISIGLVAPVRFYFYSILPTITQAPLPASLWGQITGYKVSCTTTSIDSSSDIVLRSSLLSATSRGTVLPPAKDPDGLLRE